MRRTAGEELREARERLGLSRVDLARLAGCSLSMLGNLEQGAPVGRSGVLERAERALRNLERKVAA